LEILLEEKVESLKKKTFSSHKKIKNKKKKEKGMEQLKEFTKVPQPRNPNPNPNPDSPSTLHEKGP